MPRGENRQSVLLSREENDQVFSLIGPKCQSLATAVVQLFTTEGPGHSEWKKRDTGVLCLIKDNGKRTYFFRIYCLYRKALIWEHEVYLQIEYKSPRPFLHTFEAEEYMTAFNFANVEEAKLLQKVLVEKMELRRKKREEKRQRAILANRANSVSAVAPVVRQNGAPPQPPLEPPPPALAPKATTLSASNRNTLKGNRNRRGKITKADIGAPQDFKHISHVGWDPLNGFDPPDDKLKVFLGEAGVSETQFQDEKTRIFIIEFLEKHGGLEAVKNEIEAPAPVPPPSSQPIGPLRPPPPPASAAPPVPNRNAAPAQPPAPPSRAPPPPPARAVPPPPPAPLVPRNPPPPRPIQPPSSAPPPVPPPPPPGVAPPPPPPPPLAPAPPPAPPMPMPQDAPAAGDPRSALMESIRSRNTNLRKVEATEKVPVVDGSRSTLLSEIRQGVELKAVPTRSPSGSGGSGRAPACGLAGALARALEERSRAIHSSDSDMSETSDADDDWD